MYRVLGDVPKKKAFKSKLRGKLAAIEKKISKELGTGSYSPDEVPRSPLVKQILALPDADRRAILLSLCDRIAWLRTQDAHAWHAEEILRWSMAGKRLAWTKDDVERMMAVAKKLGKEAFYLPLARIVPLVENVETISPSLRASIKALGKEMRKWESVSHHRLAKRLSALL